MVRVGADTEMETFLSGNLDQVPADIVSPYFPFVYHLGSCQTLSALVSNLPLC